jgi:hypothetical protein
MGVSHISHETDEELELYALGRLPEPRVDAVEEHLLICASCQERLDELAIFALAMREGIASEPETEARTSWFAWLPRPVWSGVLGFAVIVLAAGVYLNSGRSHVAPVASLRLTAMRGNVESVGPARETDITLEDAPAGSALRVEVVDSAGMPVWSGPLEGDSSRIRLMKQLSPDTYFARLYDAAGKLLHEYGFRVAGGV